LCCDNDRALVLRLPTGELTAQQRNGEFFTTVHEYNMALELGLITNVEVIKTVDFLEWTDFSKFILPLYENREETKRRLVDDPDNKVLQQDSKFDKYLMNNGYGKLAQNPRTWKEHYVTAVDEHPPLSWLYAGVDIEAQRAYREECRAAAYAGEPMPAPYDPAEAIAYLKRVRSMPAEETQSHKIWSIPSIEWRFNNVAAGASITGAARAKLLHARHNSVDALYCDTDSLICSGLSDSIPLSNSILGAWKLETDISECILAGKKLYGYRTPKGKEIIRAKGQQGVTWDDLRSIIGGATIIKTMFAPTITRSQGQAYMSRSLRMTAT
jgi:hypothetical protein